MATTLDAPSAYDPGTAFSSDDDGLTEIALPGCTFYDLDLKTSKDGVRKLKFLVPARHWDDILKLYRYVSTAARVSLASIDLEATIYDMDVKTRKDGARTLVLTVGSSYRQAILALCSSVGSSVELHFRFEQLPLFGRDDPKVNYVDGRKKRGDDGDD